MRDDVLQIAQCEAFSVIGAISPLSVHAAHPRANLRLLRRFCCVQRSRNDDPALQHLQLAVRIVVQALHFIEACRLAGNLHLGRGVLL